jgi:hypothetical protein
VSAVEKFRALQLQVAAPHDITPFPGATLRGTGHLTEASQEDWFWGRINANSTEEDYYWRRLSDNWAQKDVLPAAYLDIHNQVFEAYNANPMANAIVEMGVNFVLGEGLTVDAKHPKVQKLIDAFWQDPDNRMATRQFDLATELSLYGELFIRVFVNPWNGHLKLAHIDPSLIDELVTDPENIERLLRIHRRALAQTTLPTIPGGPPLIQPLPDDPKQEGTWFEVPTEVMHFAINKVTNAKRGKSDLATLLPWLRRYKDWLIDRVRINKYKAAFLWDVKLTGADRRTIEDKMQAYARPPEPGSVLVHNESEEWTAVQPHIAGDDVQADGHAIKLMVAMGAGIPEHYLSEGGDVNRATAAEMGLPILKKYQRRQDYLKHVLSSLLDRVIVEAQLAGTLPRTIDTSYEIRFPLLEPENAKETGNAAWAMAQGLQIARSLGIVSQESSVQLFFDAAREAVDVGEELRKLEAETPVPGVPPAVPEPVGVSSERPSSPSTSHGAKPNRSPAERNKS